MTNNLPLHLVLAACATTITQALTPHTTTTTTTYTTHTRRTAISVAPAIAAAATAPAPHLRPAHAATELSENERRAKLDQLIQSRGGLDPARRGQFNEKAVFSEDFYFKYGLRPSPAEVNARPKDDLPFSPVQRRYTGFSKYSERILSGLSSYASLEADVSKGELEALLPALEPGTKSKGDANKAVPPSEVRSLARVLGLFANTALQSENESTSQYNLLARHLVNEYYFCLDDLAVAAKDGDREAAIVAWRAGREYLNAYLGLVNPTINSRVGTPFALL